MSEEDRKFYATHRVVVNTNPPIHLNDRFVALSGKINSMKIAYQAIETDKFGNRCILKMSNDDMPIDVWQLFSYLLDRTLTKNKPVYTTITFDHLFATFIKYQISYEFMDPKDKELLFKICFNTIGKQQFVRLPLVIQDNLYCPMIIQMNFDTVMKIMHKDGRLAFMRELKNRSLWVYMNLTEKLALAYLN